MAGVVVELGGAPYHTIMTTVHTTMASIILLERDRPARLQVSTLHIKH